jgi:hypothetical protein
VIGDRLLLLLARSRAERQRPRYAASLGHKRRHRAALGRGPLLRICRRIDRLERGDRIGALTRGKPRCGLDGASSRRNRRQMTLLGGGTPHSRMVRFDAVASSQIPLAA